MGTCQAELREPAHLHPSAAERWAEARRDDEDAADAAILVQAHSLLRSTSIALRRLESLSSRSARIAGPDDLARGIEDMLGDLRSAIAERGGTLPG
jgi:hypothetical protein